MRISTKFPALAAAAGVVLAGLALAAWALVVEPRWLRVRRLTLRLPEWPAELAGLRVAVLGDLHAGARPMRHARLAKVVLAVARERPDLIALLGDFVDNGAGLHPIAPADVATRLARAHAPLGTVAVLGNHDWAHAGARMAGALREAGIVALENEAHTVARNGARLWLVGVADMRERTPSLGALDAVPDGEPIILLSHDPDVFLRVPGRVALTLAAHTHGGQVNLPLLRRRFIPSREGPRYRAGLVVQDGRRLFITRGVGSTGIPARLFAPPEIAVLELVPL